MAKSPTRDNGKLRVETPAKANRIPMPRRDQQARQNKISLEAALKTGTAAGGKAVYHRR